MSYQPKHLIRRVRHIRPRSALAVAVVLLLSVMGFTQIHAFASPGGQPSFHSFPTPGAVPTPVGTQTCDLTVPPNPLSAQGLATPYVLSGSAVGCTEDNAGDTAFVQAAIISPSGAISIYSPLVINAGLTPQVAPVVPAIPRGSTVGIWFGFNNIFLNLVGAGANWCVNGLPNSDFGQFAYCDAPQFFAAADLEVVRHLLVIPPLGTEADGTTCPSINSFQIVDQDPNDNVQTEYLANPTTGATAEYNAANLAAFPGDEVLANPSDNALTTNYVDPAIGCAPWEAPNLENPGTNVPALALDQLQARAHPASPPAYVELSDEMTLVNGDLSQTKTNLYRIGVDQPLTIDDSEATWCTGMATVFPAWLQSNEALFTAAATPDPAAATNLYTFLGERFVASYEMLLPEPGIMPTCDSVTGVADPISVTTNGQGVATGVTVN